MPPKADGTIAHIDRKRKYHLDSFDITVQTIVGPERYPFQIHKKPLCDVSTYFNAVLNGNFKEVWEETVKMPKVEVDIFKHFQYCLYSKTNQSENDIDRRILIGLFILGEARGILDLQNAAIDGLIDKQATEENSPLEQISYVYDNTTDYSPLRQLFVGFTHTHAVFDPEAGPDGWFSSEQYETCTKRFYFDLSVALCQTTFGLEIRQLQDRPFQLLRPGFRLKHGQETMEVCKDLDPTRFLSDALRSLEP